MLFLSFHLRRKISNLIKPRYIQLLVNISRNSDDILKISVYKIAGAQAVVISRFGDRI